LGKQAPKFIDFVQKSLNLSIYGSPRREPHMFLPAKAAESSSGSLTRHQVEGLAKDLNIKGDLAMHGDDSATEAIKRALTSLTDEDYKRVYNEMNRHSRDLELFKSKDGFPIVSFAPTLAEATIAQIKHEPMRRVSMTLQNHSAPDRCVRYNVRPKMLVGWNCYHVDD